MDITGKKIILTGAASGIGASLLKEFGRYDCTVVVVDINETQLQKTLQSLANTKAKYVLFYEDISNPQKIDELFEFAQREMKQIDIFIANAGFAYYESIEKSDWQRIEKIYRLNVFSPIYSAEKMQEISLNNPYTFVFIASAMAHIGMCQGFCNKLIKEIKKDLVLLWVD